MAVSMQENAWNDIKDVDRPEGWCKCEECGGELKDVATNPLPDGRMRRACQNCMQRYNYKAIPTYQDFGIF